MGTNNYGWLVLLLPLAWLVSKGLVYWYNWNSLMRAFEVTEKDKFGLDFKDRKRLLHERYWNLERLLRHRMLTFVKNTAPTLPDSLLKDIETALMRPMLECHVDGYAVILHLRGAENPHVLAQLEVCLIELPRDIYADVLRYNDVRVNPVMRRIIEEQRHTRPHPLRPEA